MIRPLPDGEPVGFLPSGADPAVGAAGPGASAGDGPARGPSSGVLAGRYELRGLIGRGGMAEVHRGHDLDLDRPVAVKLLPREHQGDPEYAARLRDEARAAAALNHPNVVSVYDVGVAGRDVFVVMECVEGRTLREDLEERGRLAEAEAAGAAAAVCDALAVAHDHGIVHRDVNPGNVMRCDDGTVKLMDFGIARVADVGGFTNTGVVIGTAAYMSPEQVRCETLDGRSDVYSLGCTLYELVTAETPFPGPSSVEIASRRLRESPMPPRRLVRTVSRELDAVILQAMALEPNARFPDARAMAAELRVIADPARLQPPATTRDPGPADPDRTDVLDADDGGRPGAREARYSSRDARHPSRGALAGPDDAPEAGEHEPWSAARTIGLVLIVLAVLAVLVAGAFRVLGLG